MSKRCPRVSLHHWKVKKWRTVIVFKLKSDNNEHESRQYNEAIVLSVFSHARGHFHLKTIKPSNNILLFPYRQLLLAAKFVLFPALLTSTGQPSVFWAHKSVCHYRGGATGPPFITPERKQSNKDRKQLGRTLHELLRPPLFRVEKDRGASVNSCVWELQQGRQWGELRSTVRWDRHPFTRPHPR